MQEKWLPIEDFPDYAVSSLGRVCNLRRDTLLTPSINAQGIVRVAMYHPGGRLTSRSLAVLVAEAFLPRESEHFDTPIQLNGDRQDCCVDNLMWRPRWFAVRFHKQFYVEDFIHIRRIFREVTTGEVFNNYVEPCSRYGLYYLDIIKSYLNGDWVFPTHQIFELVT